ncbi:MAG: LysR family transcriptional regulator [Micavibrio sp.]|nr:LysR family transcriptional regulator [Micavibrio sp.]
MAQIPTLRQLRYFLAVAETLSFSRAAAACHVTQSTLSGGLQDLEKLLGEKLFERTSRDVALTETGRDLISSARDLVTQAENFVQMARRNRPPLSSTLTLGVIPTIAPYLLPDLLPGLQSRFPQLDLNLREDITGRLLDGLDKGNVDTVLMAFPYEADHLDTMMLWDEPFLLVSAGTQMTHTAQATLQDLDNRDVLLLDDGHCLRDQAIAACRLKSSAQRKTFGATSLPTLIQMVQHGYGVTLLPAMAINPKTMPPGLSMQRFASPQPTRTIGLAWRKDSPRAAEFRVLGDFIVKTNKAR